ncbi:MAG: SH3 domain-containing protein [Ruminococcus sp.]|nr:SH3 domain-containing protein [Ruminococcus sp.]
MKKIFCFALCLFLAAVGTSCAVKNGGQIDEEQTTEADLQKIVENVYDFQGYVVVPENENYTVMHSEPDNSSDTVTNLHNGDVVDIFEFSGDWFHVKSGECEGYVQADRIVLEQPVTTAEVSSSADTAETSAETAPAETETSSAETETETTSAETSETTVTVTETSAETTHTQHEETTVTTAEPVIVTEIVYIEVPVTQTTEPVPAEPYYYEEPQPYQYTDASWLPTIDSAYIYALPSPSGYGYVYYLNISGDYDYAYVTYVTQGVETKDTLFIGENDTRLAEGSEFSGIYAYVVPYYNGEIEGETVFCSCETPYMQY